MLRRAEPNPGEFNPLVQFGWIGLNAVGEPTRVQRGALGVLARKLASKLWSVSSPV